MTLLRYYESTLFLQRYTSVTAKIALVALLYLVATGNRNPGNRLLIGVLITQLLVAGVLAAGIGGAPILISAISFVGALLLASLYIPPDAEFQVLPADDELPLARYGILLGFIACFFYPFLGSPVRGVWNLIHTPMGLVPQPTLGVFLLLAAPSASLRIRQVGCGIAALSLVLAAVDWQGGYPISAGLMGVGGAGFLVAEFIRRTQFVARTEEDDEPLVTRKATPSEPKPRKEQKSSGKSWDI